MCYKVWYMIEVKGVIEMYVENMQVSLSWNYVKCYMFNEELYDRKIVVYHM